MRIATFALSAGLLMACSRKTPEKTEPPTPTGKSAPVTSSGAPKPDAGVPVSEFSGTVRGVVKLAAGATLPIAPPVLSHGVKPPSMKPCPPIDVNDQKVVSQSKETGGLAPIHVALTGMKTVPPNEPKNHEIFIDACRMRPTLVGAQKGDQITITNRSEMALVPQLPGAPYMRGQLRGESQSFEAKLTQTHLQCSFGSYCGESLVVALKHPLYDVTTDQGFFTIEHVPLDQPLKVHAWHPLFKENNVEVLVTKEKPEAMVEILLTPAPPKAADAAPQEQKDEFEAVRLPDGGPMPVAPSKSRFVIKKSAPP